MATTPHRITARDVCKLDMSSYYPFVCAVNHLLLDLSQGDEGLERERKVMVVGLVHVSHLDAFLTAKIRRETLDGYVDL